jgi:hypothetical protein
MRDQVSHPYEITYKVTEPFIFPVEFGTTEDSISGWRHHRDVGCFAYFQVPCLHIEYADNKNHPET